MYNLINYVNGWRGYHRQMPIKLYETRDNQNKYITRTIEEVSDNKQWLTEVEEYYPEDIDTDYEEGVEIY